MAMLEIRNLSKYFGGLGVIRDLNFDVLKSEIFGVIGPNGAGKSTLFSIICGFLPPARGRVIFRGEDITKLKPHEVAQRGISRTFQQATLFMKSTVFDNVFTGFHLNYDVGLWKTFLHTRSARKEEETVKQKAMDILAFMGLTLLKDELAQNLSHGHQKILQICVALASNPKLLLLDEPVAGMNNEEISVVLGLIRQMRASGITIILVEHNIEVIKNLCDRILVLDHGEKIAEGSPGEVMSNKQVIEAYMGGE
jgi:branched-chain amino acid transport system ATP-binding protein